MEKREDRRNLILSHSWKNGKAEKRKTLFDWGIEMWRDGKLICLIKTKNKKIENITVINSNAPFSYGFVFFYYTHLFQGFFFLTKQNRNASGHFPLSGIF